MSNKLFATNSTVCMINEKIRQINLFQRYIANHTYFYVHECFAHVTVNHVCALPSDQKGLWMTPGSGVTNGSKSPCGYRESNLGPLEH